MSVNLLAHLLDAIVLAQAPPPQLILPNRMKLDAQLNDNDPLNWREHIIDYIDSHVRKRYKEIPGTPVAGAPGGAPAAWDPPPRIRRALAAASTVTWTKPDTNSLPKAKPNIMDFKLRAFQRVDDVLAGFDLFQTYLSGTSLPATATASKLAAKTAMRDLGAFDAFLVRYSAAINAAAAASVSLAEVFALYRTEADLVAPISMQRLDDQLPVNEKLEDISLGNHTEIVFETMIRGLWSYPFNLMFPLEAALPDVAARGPFNAKIKSFALDHWMLIIGGLDYMDKRITDRLDRVDVHDTITKFMDENRVGHGQPTNINAQKTAFAAVFADLECKWPTPPTTVSDRVVVAPKSPVLLTSFVLTEAMLLFGLNKDAGSGPFIEPIPDLKYLAYNLQHARSNVDPTKDRFIQCLASAAVAAAKQSNPKFAALKARLKPIGLPAELAFDPELFPDEHVDVFNKLTAAPIRFIYEPSNVALLADFVLRAEHAEWGAFEKNRSNLARYQTLITFYKALLA